MIRVARAVDLQGKTGIPTACPAIVMVDPGTLEAFLAISLDHQTIHLPGVDGVAVVPANLLLATIPGALQSGLQVADCESCYTAAYRKVRFIAPVKTDQKMRLLFTIVSARKLHGKTFVEMWLELRDLDTFALQAEFCQTDVYIDATD